MKRLFVLTIFITVLFCTNLFSQSDENFKSFSTFKIGFLGGINFSALSGGSVIIEGRTNLTSNVNVNFSIGYSVINKEEGYSVKTNRLVSFDNYHKYMAESYNVDEINYDVFPISAGLQYIFLHDNFSPYSVFEIGYNLYSYHTQISNSRDDGNEYNSFDELPTEYKNKPPAISNDKSYSVAFGIGTNLKLSSAINLDFRYLYQLNKSLINVNQILVGINF